MHRRKLLALAFTVLPLAAAGAGAESAPEKPKTDPQVPGANAETMRPGEPLGERLDRNMGVIHPPAGIDPEIQATVPDPRPQTTPVIPPPGTPGGDQSIQPK